MNRGRTAGAVAFLLGVVAAVVLLGCTPVKRYQVLSVFFDGVPDPSAVSATAVRGASGRVVYIHKPFAEGESKCGTCHVSSGDVFARAKVRPGVCLDCHAGVKTQHAVMHGPVVNDVCMMCHSAHQSANEHLLKRPAPAVCNQCHAGDSLSPVTVEHMNPKADCLTCHSGHGGADRAFLKPTTRPATGNGDTGRLVAVGPAVAPTGASAPNKDADTERGAVR